VSPLCVLKERESCLGGAEKHFRGSSLLGGLNGKLLALALCLRLSLFIFPIRVALRDTVCVPAGRAGTENNMRGAAAAIQAWNILFFAPCLLKLTRKGHTGFVRLHHPWNWHPAFRSLRPSLGMDSGVISDWRRSRDAPTSL
jgi:hypothetical protein